MRREILVCPVSDSLTVKFREVAEHQRKLCDRRCGSFLAISDHRIFKRDAFRIIFPNHSSAVSSLAKTLRWSWSPTSLPVLTQINTVFF
jgi:hypothetical protein